jgi:hypothetical protein
MTTTRTIHCPSCRFQIQAGDMDLQTMSARCRVCQSLVDLRPAEAPAAPLPVPLPERITVSTDGGELRIERRWFTWVAIFTALFCVMWFGTLAFFYAIVFASGNLHLLLFPLLHVAVGLGLAYWTVAMFVNRTHIVVAGGKLSIRHRPLPWFGSRDIPTNALEQLYCDQHVSRTRNGTTITFSVRARGTDGKLVKLVSGLPDRDQAFFIEQEVERHLGIADRPVASQISR